MTGKLRTTLISIVAGAALAAGGISIASAGPGEKKTEAKQQKAEVSPQARATISTLHQKNQQEIEMATMAQKKAQSPEVREYARMIEQEHRMNDKQLTSMARDMNVKLEAKPDKAEAKKAAATKKRLQAAKGERFDQVYMQTMVEGHREAIDKLEQAQEQVDNEQVEQLISSSLPALRKHLEEAQQLQRTMASR